MSEVNVEWFLKFLEDIGAYDLILKDREYFMSAMENGSKEYPIGIMFGCKMYIKAEFDYRESSFLKPLEMETKGVE